MNSITVSDRQDIISNKLQDIVEEIIDIGNINRVSYAIHFGVYANITKECRSFTIQVGDTVEAHVDKTD